MLGRQLGGSQATWGVRDSARDQAYVTRSGLREAARRESADGPQPRPGTSRLSCRTRGGPLTRPANDIGPGGIIRCPSPPRGGGGSGAGRARAQVYTIRANTPILCVATPARLLASLPLCRTHSHLARRCFLGPAPIFFPWPIRIERRRLEQKPQVTAHIKKTKRPVHIKLGVAKSQRSKAYSGSLPSKHEAVPGTACGPACKPQCAAGFGASPASPRPGKSGVARNCGRPGASSEPADSVRAMTSV